MIVEAKSKELSEKIKAVLIKYGLNPDRISKGEIK